ncbi:MAG: hypothetical protein J07HQW2_00236 [Haloquadratum walsbyi J07HQW2]|uniref:Uncharacterized protein n=1 Tax=Haloquadratum walsbyi J07HQW2 TaxID=1238425 RepID=U1PJG4_9EURY|nr:MAG: hypothetical protein J07HQW2_00236 [Haloquadratum walsbyi J07HQW2]
MTNTTHETGLECDHNHGQSESISSLPIMTGTVRITASVQAGTVVGTYHRDIPLASTVIEAEI